MRIGRRILLLLCALLGAVTVLGTWCAGTASAHINSPTVYAVVDRVHPSLPPSVDVTVENGPFTILAVQNPTDTNLDVIGPDGEPFIRVGPAGALANLNSSQWYVSNSPSPSADVPEYARKQSTPRWGRVSRLPRWGLFDERVSAENGPHRHVPTTETQVTRLGEWSVPLRYGDTTVQVHGHLEYRPDLGTAVPRLTSPGELAPGVRVDLLPGSTPAIYLENSTNRTVLVRGRQGEPFARIGPSGAQVNVHSATYAEDQRAQGLRPQGAVNPLLRPSWVRVSTTSSLTWLDSRADSVGQPTGEALQEARPVTLGRWEIPLTIGGQQQRVEGETVWRPSPRYAAQVRAEAEDLPVSPLGIGAGAVSAALVVLVVWVARRPLRHSAS
jgi:hypothetical protein